MKVGLKFHFLRAETCIPPGNTQDILGCRRKKVKPLLQFIFLKSNLEATASKVLLICNRHLDTGPSAQSVIASSQQRG